jgi:hypothetical protein
MAMTFRILWRVQPVKSGATAIIARSVETHQGQQNKHFWHMGLDVNPA